MISIRIGAQERKWPGDGDEKWVHEQINGLRRDGQGVCVQITIQHAPINMILAAGSCPPACGGGRPFNREELQIFDIWQKLRLQDNSGFGPGQVVAFLKQVGHKS